MNRTDNQVQIANLLLVTPSPGEFKGVEKATGNAIDVMSIFVEMNIYHDMDIPFAAGDIILEESIALREVLPIMGVEKLLVKFRSIGDNQEIDWYEREFWVYAIEDFKNLKNRTTQYRVKFCDPHVFYNLDAWLSIRFTGNIKDIATTICTKQLYLKEDWLDFEEAKYDHDIIVPGWKPFQLLTHLCNTAIGKKSDCPDMVFFPDTDGKFIIKSYKTILEKKPEITFKFHAIQADGNSYEPFNITSFEIPSLFNTLEETSNGLSGITTVDVDLLRKSVTPRSASNGELREKITSPIDENAVPPTRNDATENGFYEQPKGNYRMFYSGLSEYSRYASEYDMYRIPTIMANNTIIINAMTTGNSALRLGVPVTLNIPSFRQLGSEEDNKDRYLYGTYIISKIRHTITPLKHICSVQFCKTAYTNDVEQVDGALFFSKED